MTKLQKVGIAVVAFCLTVAVTRRVQQEIDKQALEVDKEAFLKLQQAKAMSLTEGLWEYQTCEKGKYVFAHLVAGQPTTYWYASLNRVHEQGSKSRLTELLINDSPIHASVEKETGNLRVSLAGIYVPENFFFEIDYQKLDSQNPLDELFKQK